MFLLLQMFVFVLPGQAEVNWNEVSRSINDSFSGGRLVEKIFGLSVIALALALILQIFRISWSKKEKELCQKRRNRIVLRPLGQQQKRRWFRLRTDIEFKWITAAEALKAKRTHYKKDQMIDISGGGLSFATAEKLDPGDGIKLLLDIGGDKPMSLNGRVVRIEENVPNSGYKVSIQFEKILNGERDRVISLIMKHQRDTIHEKKKMEEPLPVVEEQ